MSEILSGQFFWGIVIGLLLSFLGGYVLAKFTAMMTIKNNKKTVINFCIDTIKNVEAIINELDATRDRMKAIHHDFLNLIEIEITIYGRNREHLINLPEDVRNQVRKFMNDCAIKRAEITQKLDQFYRINAFADQLSSQGQGPQAQRERSNANAILQDAQNSADRLVKIAANSPSIIDALSRL